MLAPDFDPDFEEGRFAHVTHMFSKRGWRVMSFQREAWSAYLDGESGLIHSPTGSGKTLAAWLGPVIEALENQVQSTRSRSRRVVSKAGSDTQVLWITPLKALANDIRENLCDATDAMQLNWKIEVRTGDTSSSARQRQRKHPPHALITTPESLSLMLSYADVGERLANLRCIVVDEWHELIGSKRGVQLELCLARLRQMNPELRIWALSATIGNLTEAMHVLLGQGDRGRIIEGPQSKSVIVQSLIPTHMDRFPWAGHLGTQLLQPVVDQIEKARTTLLFTNTRSQAELWYQAIATERLDWIDQMALHHGSISTRLRQKIETALRAGQLKCVVCTSSLDLGVDFSPVEQVLQIGSPKGIARLAQRAGRSGHRPGETSSIVCVPTHSFELIEVAAARRGLIEGRVESRRPQTRSLDVLVQHAMTLATGVGFEAAELLAEVRSTHAFRALTDLEWQWTLDFLTRGGNALSAYPHYRRVIADNGRYTVADGFIARRHRMSIGTITSDAEMQVRWLKGGKLGSIEESFVARLKPGERFIFAGRSLQLVRVRDMVAYVKASPGRTRNVPRWQGGRLPLSTELAESVLRLLAAANEGRFDDTEMRSVRPMLELQRRWSRLPEPSLLVAENVRTREGHHLFVYTFCGRAVNQGLAALIAYRLSKERPRTFALSANDYGIELVCADPVDIDEASMRALLSLERLTEDLIACLNVSEMARRQFRDIARIAGLVFQGFPGQGKSAKQLQVSSGLMFDVLTRYDQSNLLLDQAQREVLDQQLESVRMRQALEVLATRNILVTAPPKITPLGFPLWAERLQSQVISSETARERIQRMVADLERAADRGVRKRTRA